MKELAQRIKKKQVILFVGAGLSATLNLPTWKELMDHIAEKLGWDPNVFRLCGDNLALAEYYHIHKGSIGALRSWMDKSWNVDDEKIKESEIYNNLVALDFPIIYTTNYDNCLETAYRINGKPYNKILKVEDICNCSNNTTQIVKFHGDFEDDNSIVLTESSYFKRMDFETPLDIKLRSDMLGKSILFIGYSLSDINIRYLTYKLEQLWKTSASRRPKSYIFMANPNPIQEAILESRNIRPIVSEEADPTKGLNEFIKELLELVR